MNADLEFQHLCHRHALQCFRWAAKIDDVTQQLTFTLIAREWLDAAKAVALDPTNAAALVRSRLH
jgi:hypothetical protein